MINEKRKVNNGKLKVNNGKLKVSEHIYHCSFLVFPNHLSFIIFNL